jgi:competence protein ComEC
MYIATDFKYKTEIFFILSVIFAFIQKDNILIQILFTTLVFMFFLPKQIFKYFILLILFLIVFLHYSTFILNKSTHYGNKISYKTTKGIYKSNEQFDMGDILIGNFKIQNKKYYKLITTDSKPFSLKLPFISSILKLRKEIGEKFYYLSGGKLAFPQALLLGDKTYLSNDTKDIFTVLGLNHLLAVSGMHVGILLTIIYFLTYKIPFKIRYLFMIFFLFLFVFLAGLKIPVLRSAVFASIILSALFFDTKTNIKKLLLFVASIFILISPSTIKDISFILSFSAVFGIIYILEQKKNIIYSIFLTGIVATAFTLPAVLYFFGIFNVLSIFNTIVVLPLCYLILLTSLFGLFFTKLSIAPLILSEKILGFISDTLYIFSKKTLILNKIDIYTLLIIIFILFLSVYYKKIIFVLLVLAIPFLNISKENALYLPAFKRSKAIIQTGNQSSIFFIGNHSDFRYKLLPYLAKLKIKNFEYGKIKIFGGENYFIKIKKNGLNFDKLCINIKEKNCDFIYKTKSNSLSYSDIDYNKKYIVYKNKFKSENIFELKYTGDLIIKNGKLYASKNK